MKKKQEWEKPIDHGRHHKKPVTRRDFLAQGYITSVGSVMAPSLFSLLSQRAYGANCEVPAVTNRIPFLSMELAGGGNIAGSNVIVGKQGGQKDFLESYESLSLSNAVSPKTSEENIIALNGDKNNSLLFHKQSPFYRGFASVTSETTRANMDGVLFCAASIDDTGANPFNPLYWINKVGLEGDLVAMVASGSRSVAPANSINPLKAPVGIANAASTQSLIDIGKLGDMLSPQKAEEVLKAVSAMSLGQLKKFNKLQLPDKIKELVSCGYINSASMINRFTPDELDPTKDGIISGLYPDFVEKNGQSAAITKLVLDGFAGSGNLILGGYDYHTRDFRSEGKDEDAGKHAGLMMEAAAQKGVPLVLYIYTDGGVASTPVGELNGKFPWRSESGVRAGSFLMIYDPKGKPKIRNGKRQVGWFNDNGAVNTTATVFSSSIENLTKLIVANYLALFGREGELASIVGDDPFGDSLESMLSFSSDTLGS